MHAVKMARKARATDEYKQKKAEQLAKFEVIRIKICTEFPFVIPNGNTSSLKARSWLEHKFGCVLDKIPKSYEYPFTMDGPDLRFRTKAEADDFESFNNR